MKKVIQHIFVALCALVAASCTEGPVESVELTLSPGIATKGLVTGTGLADSDAAASRYIILSGWMKASNGREENYFTGEAFAPDGTSGLWRHDPPLYMPVGSTVDMLGYSASVAIDPQDVTWGWLNNAERMRLTVGEGHLMDDIFYGASYGNRSADGGRVTLTMSHAQAWIEIRASRKEGAADVPVMISAVTLSDVFTGGELTVEALGGHPAASWSTRRFAPRDLVMPDPQGTFYGSNITTGHSVYVLLPEQSQGSIVVEYTVSGYPLRKEYALPHADWCAGNHYVYGFEFDPLTEVFVLASVTMEPWVEGSVYTETI